MNIKINTICFIILLFLLAGTVSATEDDNETLQQTIIQPEDEIYHVNLENQEKLNTTVDELKLSASNVDKLESSDKTVLTATKSTKTKTIITAPNLNAYYKDGSKFTVTLKDSSKKVIKNAKVKITINGKTYSRTTDSKGKASLTINLNSGKYTVTTSYEGSKNYYSQIAKSTVTVKSTIKSSNLVKYYKNIASYYSKFYDKKGNLLKKTQVKINLNGKTYAVKTNTKGIAKLSVDLKPGKYTVTPVNTKTSETASYQIYIKTILETNNLTMQENDGSVFSVKVLNCYGKASPNKKVTLTVNGKTYTPISNSSGIATQKIDLTEGTYYITTEYEGLKHVNLITVTPGIKHTEFSHITQIPNYINLTVPYVFHNSNYAIKTGSDGIIKLPKTEVFTIHINETTHYTFSTNYLSDVDSIVIGYSTYLVPFDGSGVKSNFNKNNLKGDGILISKTANYTQIEFRSTTQLNTDLFGVMMDKKYDNIELITYLQNDLVKARIMFFTGYYDELGLKSNLVKLYGKSINDIDSKSYDYLTSGNSDKIKYVNTGETVKYSESGKYIIGSYSKEHLTTKFIVNGVEELEKIETISYGLSDKYQPLRGFEVLQSYAIINEKVTRDTLEKWLKVSNKYYPLIGINNIYGMFMAGLETTWLADEIADEFAKDLNVSWNRSNTVTLLGGINLDDTYIHILNADMGMSVSGTDDNCKLFRIMNSYYLPNIESYVLTPISDAYSDNIVNSLDNIYNCVENNNFSIVQMGEIFYILSEDNSNTAIVINSTSGVSNIILIDNDFAYKGSKIQTRCDCCSVNSLFASIINSIGNTLNTVKNTGKDIINNVINNIHPLISLIYDSVKLGSTFAGLFFPNAVTGLSSTIGSILLVHSIGNKAKNLKDENDWHWAYKHVTFTRDGLTENKKFFNIPKSDGTYDYIEVEINSDGSLNRNNALYVGEGYSKKLTKEETYQYFTEEKWTSCNIPRKYQKYSVPEL